jgi:outer membrane protein OmpA-like peptidoglycan-associated protein
MKRITNALMVLALASTTFGCAVTRAQQGHPTGTDYVLPTTALAGMAVGGAAGGAIGYAIEGTTGALVGALGGVVLGALVGDWNETRCMRMMAYAGPDSSDWDAERDRLLQRIAELEARPPEKEIVYQEVEVPVEVPVEVVHEVQLPGKEIQRYVLATDMLFAPGKDILTAEGKASIDAAVADIRAQFPGKRINIEGHTDTDPIKVSNWRSNWELGSARALAVLHYLEDHHGVQGNLLSATTFSYHQPVAGNETREGKALNRRAAIVIYAEE